MPLEIDVLYEFDEEKIRREYIDKKPYVLKGVGSKWPAMSWNPLSVHLAGLDQNGNTAGSSFLVPS